MHIAARELKRVFQLLWRKLMCCKLQILTLTAGNCVCCEGWVVLLCEHNLSKACP